MVSRVLSGEYISLDLEGQSKAEDGNIFGTASWME